MWRGWFKSERKKSSAAARQWSAEGWACGEGDGLGGVPVIDSQGLIKVEWAGCAGVEDKQRQEQ